ncbi:hypothetical protein [Devriesea agamarum]|nr:hypothetical protein [Devriesea agamarum]
MNGQFLIDAAWTNPFPIPAWGIRNRIAFEFDSGIVVTEGV